MSQELSWQKYIYQHILNAEKRKVRDRGRRKEGKNNDTYMCLVINYKE